MLFVLMVGFGLWFAYDGYLNEDYIKENTDNYGTPEAKANSDLMLNRQLPFYLGSGAVIVVIYFFMIKGKMLIADEEGIKTSKNSIAYESIQSIDKTHFDTKGYFVIAYKDQQQNESRLKLTDRTYDNLQAVLDALIAKIS